jgi:hypothetical protein
MHARGPVRRLESRCEGRIIRGLEGTEGNMPKLKLLDIRCIRNQEMGGDEPYLKVRNNKVWSSEDMKAGMVVSLRSLQPIAFKEEIDVTLMEKDWRDDCLGTGTITSDALGQGQQEINFTEEGAHYQLIYEVIP